MRWGLMRELTERGMSQEALLDVLREARELLSRSGNDFSWSRWKSEKDAVADIDGLIGRIDAAETIRLIEIHALFAPTGSLQEVSIDSGWGDQFLDLAARF